mmetsp:Transcript_19264/g.39366  ORF Transcript_19264/g.39366 Transcript_19264/m.39366 type:complete len:436 (-) Transcript_19264:965-2272(-)|eukprot:CAMPEP_0174706282 /NCGR_PEP_ID=MMETSP1094-20130205/9194_1 /TAXON_ID=156173 /ORGANISM="Chrysochromulina brevifilum, Strain UTEX LB 985" /LENGTH=435 /DNA_ID=CAMNT_0015904535 /DNA_START=104 /DNA_END=1411 /DNA_ORIENTATION=+
MASQILDYFNALVDGSHPPSACASQLTATKSMCTPRLVADHAQQPLEFASIVAFGGSMTAGDPRDIGHACADSEERLCTSTRGQPYPVLLARKLVEHGFAQAAYVRNLAESALHGAAVPALCIEKLLSRGTTRPSHSCAGTRCPGDRYGNGRVWWANATHVQNMRDEPPAQLHEQPVDIALIEFSINGIEYVDVLLRQLRARYPRAILVYVDHFRLTDWRLLKPECVNVEPTGTTMKARNLGGPCSFHKRFTVRPDFLSAPNCTGQLGRWIEEVGGAFVSLRSLLRGPGAENTPPLSDLRGGALPHSLVQPASNRSGVAPGTHGSLPNAHSVLCPMWWPTGCPMHMRWTADCACGLPSYRVLTHYFVADKYHLSQQGHDAIAGGVWAALQRIMQSLFQWPQSRAQSRAGLQLLHCPPPQPIPQAQSLNEPLPAYS